MHGLIEPDDPKKGPIHLLQSFTRREARMHDWHQTDRFESTCTIEYGGFLLRVVAVMTDGERTAQAHVFAGDTASRQEEIAFHEGCRSLDEALDRAKLTAIAYADAQAPRPSLAG